MLRHRGTPAPFPTPAETRSCRHCTYVRTYPRTYMRKSFELETTTGWPVRYPRCIRVIADRFLQSRANIDPTAPACTPCNHREPASGPQLPVFMSSFRETWLPSPPHHRLALLLGLGRRPPCTGIVLKTFFGFDHRKSSFRHFVLHLLHMALLLPHVVQHHTSTGQFFAL